jgi:CRP-like cAMP-binding protein
MSTCFATPEDNIVTQGEKGQELFWIQQGDCVVNIQDRYGFLYVGHKLLLPGDHFGELSVIFKCRRTCTVVSKNYITMA